MLGGADGQRCRVQFLCNARALGPKHAGQPVAATIRTVFAQPDAANAREQWRRVADGFRTRYQRLAAVLEDAEADVVAYLIFPSEHWRKIWSNNPLEWLNREIERRTDVVVISPNPAAAVRLVAAVLADEHDGWPIGRRYCGAESPAKLHPLNESTPARLTAG